MSSETKPSSLIALASDLRKTQDETIAALEEILGKQFASCPESGKSCGSLNELQSLLVEILGNSRDILAKVNRISNTI